MMAFGDQLRRAREAQGVSLDAVADATRIPRRHLEALERSDLGGLPRGPFGKGYVRAYAEFLGIDPQPILEAYSPQERQHGLGPSDTQRQTLEELSQLMQHRSRAQYRGPFSPRLTWGALALVALGIFAAGGWFLVGRDVPEAGVETSLPPPGRSAREAEAIPDPPEADPIPEPSEAQAGRSSTPQETRTAARSSEKPTPAANAPSSGLRVSHSGVGTGVEDRRLVGRADRFVEGTQVSFWTRVLGGEPGGVIHHFWIHEGRVATRADLAIGGSHWRTHSRLQLPEGSTGSWTAEARSPDGRVLAREEFLCVSEER